MFVVTAVALVAMAIVVWGPLRKATPSDEMKAFIATPSYDVDGLRFIRFHTAPPTSESPSARLTAAYSNSATYDVHIYPEHQAAASEFHENVEDHSRWAEVQTINTYDEVERCFSARGFIYCFGMDDTRTLRSYVPSDIDDDGFKALSLLRTARKHYYRTN